jgi:hypothetical protein
LWKASPFHDLIKEQPACKSSPSWPAEPLLHSAGLSAPQAAQRPQHHARSLSLGHPAPQALLGPSFTWGDFIHALLGSPSLRPCGAPAVHRIIVYGIPAPWAPTSQAMLGPSSTCDTPPGSPPHGPCQLPAPLGSLAFSPRHQLGMRQSHLLHPKNIYKLQHSVSGRP